MRPLNGYFAFALFLVMLPLSFQGNILYGSDEGWTPSEKEEIFFQVKEVIEGHWPPQKGDEIRPSKEKMISGISDASTAIEGNRFSLRFGSFHNTERYLKFLIEAPLEEKMRVGSFVSLDNRVYSLGVVVKFLGDKTAFFRPYWYIDTSYRHPHRELVGGIGLGIERVLSSRFFFRSFLTIELEIGYQKQLKATRKEEKEVKEQKTVGNISHQGLKIEGGFAVHW